MAVVLPQLTALGGASSTEIRQGVTQFTGSQGLDGDTYELKYHKVNSHPNGENSQIAEAPVELHTNGTFPDGQMEKDVNENATVTLIDRMRSIWAAILSEEPSMFTPSDVFFEVGGDSISTQRLIDTARERGLRLTMEQIFLNASLEEMAAVAVLEESWPEHAEAIVREGDEGETIRSVGTSLGKAKVADIARACNMAEEDIESVYPLSAMQHSLLTATTAGTNSYVRQFVFTISSSTPLVKFQRAWDDTIASHPILRTRICHLDSGTGEYVQAVVRKERSDAHWRTLNVSLEQFLEWDSSTPMPLNHPFFRYTITLSTSPTGIQQRYFVWTAHHALCDGASIPAILSDVSKHFQRQSVPRRVPFESFIRSTIVDNDPLAEKEFWRKALEGVNPTPYPPAQQASQFDQMKSTSVLKRELLLDIHPPHGVTRALLLRSAWAILLSHYTGTRDVGFGVINSGRTSAVPGISQIAGPTLNLVPIAIYVDSEETISAFLSRVRHQAAAMIPFEHAGIARIRQHCHDRDTTALDFQTLFVVDGASFGEIIEESSKMLGLRYVDEAGKKEQHAYPLVLTFTLSTSRAVTLMVQHDSRVVSGQQAVNLTHHLQTVLVQLANSSAKTRIGQVSPFSENDKIQIRSWNVCMPPTERVCIHGLFREQVRHRPDAVAVCSVDEELTYADVDRYSDALAVRISALGAGLGTFVGVCFEKSIWTVVAILAVFKVGGIYVPIDLAHPRGRIEEVVQTVGVRCALASTAGRQTLDGLCEHTIVVEGRPPDLSPDFEVPLVHVPASIAYLLFTSGSTGKPKGLLMSHSAICSSIIHHGAAFGAGPHWRTLQFGAHTFDLSIGEFFTTLAHGGCICVPSEHDRLNNLDGAITALNVNALLVVPTVANLLFPKGVPSVKTIVLAGEPITKETVVRWADAVDLTCAYGPSETAVWCSGNLRVSSDAHPGNIGRSIGATMWIVDPDNHDSLSAIGCVGEIVISGALLGSGYFGDKAITDATYVPAPDWLKEMGSHQAEGYDMMYKSGDLARYNPDGTFQIVGRRDTQIKLRGFRIELGEIENQMMATGSVMAAFATLPSTGPCARQIVAVVSATKPDLKNHGRSSMVVADGKRSLVESLKASLALALPEYMVPSIWVVLAEMPLLISGKVDRRFIKTWLQEMDRTLYQQLVDEPAVDGDAAEIAPGSLADRVRRLWSDALNVPVDAISRQSSFIALGGDSISAIQIVSNAKMMDMPLAVRHIIGSRTLGKLVAVLEQSTITQQERLESPAAPETDDLFERFRPSLERRLRGRPPANVEDIYPFAPFQREIAKARSINPSVFLLSWQMEVFLLSDRPPCLERLAQAWRRVVQYHPVLRSIFLQDPTGQLPSVQAVLSKSGAEPEIVVSSAAATEAEPTFATRGTRSVDECFLPHRAHFVRHGDRYFVHIELDHLVIDGWSLKEVKKALLAAYDSDEALRVDEAPSYKTFVTAHSADRVKADNEYWAAALQEQGPSLLSLPVNPCQRTATPHSSHKTILYLPEVRADVFKSFGTQYGVTPASIFDAAWAQTLSKYTARSDVAFEYVVSGRDEDIPNVFELVGPLINVLPYHVLGVSAAEDGPAGLACLAQRMQEQRARDSLHTSSNVREIVEEYFGTEKRFNTAVNFQRRPTAVETTTVRIDDDLRKSRDPWHVSMHPSAGKCNC